MQMRPATIAHIHPDRNAVKVSNRRHLDSAIQSILQEAPQLSTPARMLQFPQELGFDLAEAFEGDRELLCDFFERVVGVRADAAVAVNAG